MTCPCHDPLVFGHVQGCYGAAHRVFCTPCCGCDCHGGLPQPWPGWRP